MTEPPTARTPPTPDTGRDAGREPSLEPAPLPEPVEAALTAVDSAFRVAVANLPRVEAALHTLGDHLARLDDPAITLCCLVRLAPLLRKRPGPLAHALFAFLTGNAGESEATDHAMPPELVNALLEARDPALRRDGVNVILDHVARGRIGVDADLALHLARRIEGRPGTGHARGARTRGSAAPRPPAPRRARHGPQSGGSALSRGHAARASRARGPRAGSLRRTCTPGPDRTAARRGRRPVSHTLPDIHPAPRTTTWWI